MFDEQFQKFVTDNPKLVTRRESVRYPGLFVVKYTRKVFYDALWNDYLEECRGLVVDEDWNPVIRPFKKIYNRGENDTDLEGWCVVTSVRKINGFMAAVTNVPGYGNVVSTTGSLDSPFVKLAEKYLLGVDRYFYPGYTYLFEICDTLDPHIITEKDGAYLIGLRSISNGVMKNEEVLDRIASEMEFLRPEWKFCQFSDVINDIKICRHEGFVVRYVDAESDISLKIKSPYYLVTKFLARKSDVRFVEMFENPQAVKQTVDEEFYPLIDYVAQNKIAFASLDEQARIFFIQEFLER